MFKSVQPKQVKSEVNLPKCLPSNQSKVTRKYLLSFVLAVIVT